MQIHDNHRVYRAEFGDQAFEINCNNDEAYSVAEFLFLDFFGTKTAKVTKQYNIISSGPAPILSLLEGNRQLYSGKSLYQLAYILMNEVIFHCIDTNDSHHALHAGCVCKGNNCIILPGKSGNGKSTLTCWLVKNGFQYLSDELVLLGYDGSILPMTRPISLKVGPDHKSWLLEGNRENIITCDTGSMIPHRLLNAKFQRQHPRITCIIYPQFSVDAIPRLQKISPAKSSLYLLQSHVNARNLQGHGISSISTIVRQCKSFTLDYGSFDDLHEIFNFGTELFT